MVNALPGLLPGSTSRLNALWARWNHVAVPVLLWVGLVVQSGLAAWWFQGPADPKWPGTGASFIGAWGHLDSVWYVRIAAEGYAYSDDGASAWAFFPAYPALVRAVAAVTGSSAAVAGYAVALVLGLGALLVVRAFAAVWLPPKRAALAASAFAVYPYSFFLRGPLYTDGMAFVFVVGAFLAVERRRIALGCLLAFLASYTRFEVVPLTIALTWRAWELRPQGDRRRSAIALLPAGFAVLGQGLVSAYSLYRVHDPIAFYHAQSYAGWQGGSVADRLMKRGYVLRLAGFVGGREGDAKSLALETMGLLAVVGACCLVPLVARRMSRAYAAFVIATIVMVVAGAASFCSSGRYLLACFPCFVVLAGLGPPRARWIVVAVALAIATQTVFAIGFARGALVG